MNSIANRIAFLFLAIVVIGGMATSSLAKPFMSLNTEKKPECRPSLWQPNCEGLSDRPDKTDKRSAVSKQGSGNIAVKKSGVSRNDDGYVRERIIYVPVHAGETVDPDTGKVIPVKNNYEQSTNQIDSAAPKTSEEYISQIIWKNIPKRFLLNEDEQKMLGNLSPEGRKIPLPLLKFLLKPVSETPEQTREDYLQYQQWVSNNMNAITSFQQNYRNKGLSGKVIESMVTKKHEISKDDMLEVRTEVEASNKYVKIPGEDLYFLYFFNSTCPNCHKMTPNVLRLVAKYPEATVIGYSRNEPIEKSKAYARRSGMKFDILKPTKKLMEQFHIDQAYPRLLMIDKKTGARVLVKGYYSMSGIHRALNYLGEKRAEIVGAKR